MLWFKNKKTKKVPDKARLFAFVHHKGGTGKTTSCINVAGWLAKMGKKVLIVDLDPQGNATTGLGIDRNSFDYSIFDVLFDEKKLEDVILESSANVYVAPSSIDMLMAEANLVDMPHLLSEKLKSVKDYFDYILIDLPPGSTMLMINGIVAARNIIIPLDSGVFAYETLEILRSHIRDIAEDLGVETNIALILVRDYPVKTFIPTQTRQIRKLVKEFLSAYCTAMPKIHIVPFSPKIFEAQKQGKPISHHSPLSNVSRVYKRITKEVMKHGVTN